MKNLILILTASLLFAGCKKDTSGSNQSVEVQSQNLSDGSWRVTNFSTSNVVRTGEFSGFRLQFETNGKVSAINDLLVKGGTYVVTKHDGKNAVTFSFPFDSSFMMLSDLGGGFWDITFQNSGEIRMQRKASDNSGGLDYLTIVKI